MCIDGANYVPKLVERCRRFEDERIPLTGTLAEEWFRLGIAESINKPENRSTT